MCVCGVGGVVRVCGCCVCVCVCVCDYVVFLSSCVLGSKSNTENKIDLAGQREGAGRNAPFQIRA